MQGTDLKAVGGSCLELTLYQSAYPDYVNVADSPSYPKYHLIQELALFGVNMSFHKHEDVTRDE